jgi:hypothetical protein
MTSHVVYRVNSPQVIFENIDGELILVHMEKGAYYTTDEVGALLWFMVESRCSAAEMAESLRFQFDADADTIESAVAAFVDRLLGEDLIVAGEPGEEPAAERTPATRVATTPKRPFVAPVLQAYRDMQDMLALDPIHDVEAAGWPVPKPDDDSVASQSA